MICGIHKIRISNKICKICKICFHALFFSCTFLLGWAACDGSLIFFLSPRMSGDGGDADDVVGRLLWRGWVDVRDNLADFCIFRSISGVCLFFCLKNTSKKAINY